MKLSCVYQRWSGKDESGRFLFGFGDFFRLLCPAWGSCCRVCLFVYLFIYLRSASENPIAASWHPRE